MEEQEIINGNILIAEFMGGKQIYDAPIGWIKGVACLPNTIDRFDLNEGKYHSSWDWLMPVVEKIEKGNYGFKMCRKVVEIYYDDSKERICYSKHKSRIESLWHAIIYFIQWHNTNQSK